MTSAEQNPNEISSVVCCLGDSSQTLSVEDVMQQFDVTREQIADVLEFVVQSLRDSVPVDAHSV